MRVPPVDEGRAGAELLVERPRTDGGPGTATYQEYLDRFVAEVEPALISFDHYMLVGPSPGVRETTSTTGCSYATSPLQTGLPSWVFILACQHFGFRLPTEAELLWQVNVSLAYGCKGTQYFTYWTPDGDGFYQGRAVRRRTAR
ncbi:hypothetical protein ACWDWO_06420 [Actinopolymorpha singaporensis]